MDSRIINNKYLKLKFIGTVLHKCPSPQDVISKALTNAGIHGSMEIAEVGDVYCLFTFLQMSAVCLHFRLCILKREGLSNFTWREVWSRSSKAEDHKFTQGLDCCSLSSNHNKIT